MQSHFYFLACWLEIEADRAIARRWPGPTRRWSRLKSLRRRDVQEALLPANALGRRGGESSITPFDLLAQLRPRKPFPIERRCGTAEVALYAAAALRFEDCDEAIGQARVALAEAGEAGNRSRRALLLIALALAIAGRSGEADAAIETASEGSELPPRLAALRAAVEALRDRCRGERNHARLSGALDGLRANDFGGVCRLFEALPFHAIFAQRVARLTPAQRTILQPLVAGGDVPEREADAVRAALDCASVSAMRETVVRTSALHGATLARVPA